MTKEVDEPVTCIIPEMHVIHETPDEAALELVQKMNAVVANHPLTQDNPQLRALYTDATSFRFLRARNFDFTKASELLIEDIKWRSEYKPYLIRASDIEAQGVTGKLRVSPQLDRHGRPVLIMHAKYENSQDHEANIRFLMWQIERCQHMMQGNVGKYAVFLNMESYSIWNSPPKKVSDQTLKILADRYPETLGSAIIVNAPFYFRAFFKIISPFIDSRTKSKIKFVTGDMKAGGEGDLIMNDVIGPDWRVITGFEQPQPDASVAPGYDHATYWEMVRDQEALWFTNEKLPEIIATDDIPTTEVESPVIQESMEASSPVV